jgi:hypothetical protein
MADIHWLNPVSGDFNTGTNWSGGTVPGVSDNVVLGALGGTPYTVTDGSAGNQVHTLQVAANATLNIGVSVYQQTNFQALYGGGNAGMIDVVAGDIVLANASFSNSGVITLGSGARGQLIVEGAPPVTLNGGGQVVLNSGGSLIFGYSGSSLVNVDNTISGTGFINTYGTNESKGVIDATDAGALLISDDSITNNGLIEATGTVANTFLDIRRGANVDQTGGGTILAADGAMVILETVQIAGGTLTTVGAGVIQIEGQTLLDGSASALANKATIDLLSNVNGYSLTLKGAIDDSGTINVNTGAPTGRVVDLIVDPAGVTLTGAGAITLNGDGNGHIVGGAAGAVLTNVDNTISGAGYIGGAYLTVINQAKGVIDANAAGALTLSAGSTTTVNAGLIEATGAGGLTVAGAITNTGTLLAAGGTLAINGALTNLVGTTLTGGTLEAAAGSTLNLNSSAKIVTDDATLILSGANSVIQGAATVESTLTTIGKSGTLEILGGRNWTTTLAMSNAGTLDLGGGTFTAPSLSNTGVVSGFGVLATKLTNTGSLAVTGGDTLSLVGGSLTNLSGTTLTGGTYTVGAGGTLQLANNVSIATLNATIDLAGAGATIQSLNTTTSKQVSLASSLTTIDAGGVLEILGNGGYATANSIANAGTLDLGGGTLTAGALANTGTLSGFGAVDAAVTDSGVVSVQAGKTLTFQNGSLALTGAAVATVGAGATLQLQDNVPFQIDDFTVVLNGVGSVIQSFDTTTSTELTFEEGSTGLSATGVLEILGGRDYTTTNTYANAGTIDLGGGTFTSGTLTDAAGSTLTGFGTVASSFSDAGATTATGGPLAFTGMGDTFSAALAGAEIDFAGGTDLLSSGSSLTASAVGVSGGAVVTLGASQTYAGKLTQAAGTTLALGANTLTLTGSGSTLAGSVTGTGGTLALAGGSQAIDTGASLGVSNWSLAGGDTTAVNEKLTFAGVFSDAAGTSLTIGSGDTLIFDRAGGSLVNAGTVALANGAAAANLIFGADTTLGGGGTVALGTGKLNRLYGSGASTVLTNVDNTISGTGFIGLSRLTLVNQAKGVIDAAGGVIVLETPGGTLVNTGLLEATGGGHLNIQKTIIDNSGGVISAATGSTINLQGASLIGGTLQSAGNGDFATFLNANLIDGTTSAVTNEATVSVSDNTNLTMQGAVINADRIVVSASSHNTHLTVGSAGLTLSGGGTVTLSNNALNRLSGATAAATLTNVDNKIEGAGQLGDGSMTLINQAKGVIDADGTAALFINTGANTVANAGTIEAVGAGGATIKSAVANSGVLEAAGGVLTADAAVTGTGTAAISGGTLDFLSTFSQAVAFTGKTGTLELAQSRNYGGSISGFSKTGGTSLDLLDIAFKSAGEATFSGTATSGTLTVTDGTHTARITLIGDYLGSTFTASSDGHGGTTVVDPAKGGAMTPPPHQFIAAMAGMGAGKGGPLGATGEVHPDAMRPALATPRMTQMA